MDIRKFQNRKRSLEAELAEALQQVISKFKADTGVNVLAVDVNVYRFHCIDEPTPDSTVGTVSVQTDL